MFVPRKLPTSTGLHFREVCHVLKLQSGWMHFDEARTEGNYLPTTAPSQFAEEGLDRYAKAVK